jgi:hypothetical protein
MWQRWIRIAPVLLVMLLLYLAGCSKNPTSPLDGRRNQFPETELTYAPVESTTTMFRVHVYWYGFDRDGEVVNYRFGIDSDTLKPTSEWRSTRANDSVFTFQVATGDLVGAHAFWIAAEDNDGNFDPTPAKRFFSIRTMPPSAWFTKGPDNFQLTGFDVKYEWTGTDPDGGRYANPALPDSMVRPSLPEAFEYLMLWPGRSIVEGHPELPVFTRDAYARLIQEANGPALQPPHDDWKWTRTTERSHVFTSLPPGPVVVAIRAVDAAGAKDTLLTFGRNIRTFTVRTPQLLARYPTLALTADVLRNSVLSQDSIPTTVWAEALEGTAPRFSWSAVPGELGTPIAGYSAAIDDTTTQAWRTIELSTTSAQLTDLSPGLHSFFLRAVDEVGRTVLIVTQLSVVHFGFRDPGSPSTALYVDDFASPPGDWFTALRGGPNFPGDGDEDAWWNATLLGPLAQEFGYTFEQFDPVYMSAISIDGRTPPTLEALARHRVVIWSVDMNNTLSNPTALWRTVQARNWSPLAQYVRAGGTLIVTGFHLAATASQIPDVPNSAFAAGMCAVITPGSSYWSGEYFLRDYMGIDGAKSSDASSRAAGSKDFVQARVTPRGAALGFEMAEVDTGVAAKWDPYAYSPDTDPDHRLAPGLPKVEGWKLEAALGCRADESAFRRENPALPIASPLFTYHGVNEGVLQDGSPSPREGLVVGIATQAHDEGNGDGSVVTPGNARGVLGRMVFLGFPIYYLKDAEAYKVMRAAFAYVSGSPTLGGGTP